MNDEKRNLKSQLKQLEQKLFLLQTSDYINNQINKDNQKEVSQKLMAIRAKLNSLK